MADTLTLTAADKVERDYAAANAANHWLQARPALLAAAEAQQRAYIGWMRAYAARYPEEAHLLPSLSRDPDMAEYQAVRRACLAYDMARVEHRNASIDAATTR